MAITGPIPLPQNGMDAFLEGATKSQAIFDSMMQNKLRPYQMSLMSAQAQEAQGKAGEANMWSQILNGYFGGSGNHISSIPSSTTTSPPPTTSTNNNAVDVGNMTPGESYTNNTSQPQNVNVGRRGEMLNEGQMNSGSTSAPMSSPSSSPSLKRNPMLDTLVAAKLGVNMIPINQDGKVGYFNPMTGESNFTQVGETAEQKRLGEARQKGTEKLLTSTAASSQASSTIDNATKGLEEVMNDPNYEHLAGTWEGYGMGIRPFGLPIGAIISKNFPKADQQLYGKASNYMGDIVTSFGQLFKGPYKNMINGLVNQMKPNLGDPIDVQKGKVAGLRTLKEYGLKQNRLIEQYVNSGMPNSEAIIKASEVIPFTQIRSDVERSMKENQENAAKMRNANKATSGMNSITIIDSNGKEHQIDSDKFEQAKEIDPGIQKKGMKNE